MPEEKYGDIDVNPIETNLDSKNITLKETPAASGESLIGSNNTLVSKEMPVAQESSENMNESEISDKLEVTDSEATPSLSETNFDMKPEAEPSEEKAKITPEVTLEPEVAASPERSHRRHYYCFTRRGLWRCCNYLQSAREGCC